MKPVEALTLQSRTWWPPSLGHDSPLMLPSLIDKVQLLTPVWVCAHKLISILLIPGMEWLSRLLLATTSKACCCFLISKIADWNSYRPVAGVSLLYYESPFWNTCSLRGMQTYSNRSQTEALLCAVSLVAMPCNTLLVCTMKQLHRLSSFTFFLWELLCFVFCFFELCKENECLK